MDYTITISEAALRTITLSTLEAYVLGDGRNQNKQKHSPVETLGYLWGFKRRDTEGTTHFHVELMNLSISAARDSYSVIPDERALRLKNALMQRWAPHLALIGDFHSHPYESVAAVNEVQGFEFSDADVNSFLGDDVLWKFADFEPIVLVMTVCRLARVHEKDSAENIRWNIATFDVGEFRFWLNAAVGFQNSKGGRSWTKNRRSTVQLWLDSRFYNFSRDHLLAE